MTYSIRPVTVQDVGTVAALIAALLHELAPAHEPDIKALGNVARDLLAIESVIGALAFDGKVAIGLIMLNECAAIYAGGRFGEISELYVAPPYRSQGVAKGLIDHAISEGTHRRWKRIEVGAPQQPEWARSLRFYMREGFDEVGPRLRRLL